MEESIVEESPLPKVGRFERMDAESWAGDDVNMVTKPRQRRSRKHSGKREAIMGGGKGGEGRRWGERRSR